MFKSFVSLSCAALVVASTTYAAEQGSRRIICGKSLSAVCEDAATPPKASTKASALPILDIGFDRLEACFTEGERVVVTVTVRKDVEEKYLYLFNVDCSGQTSVLYPNAWHERNGEPNLIKGGTQLTIPSPENKGFRIEVVGPSFGTERLIAVLTAEPIDPTKVGAESFTTADVTPVDSIRFKSLLAIVESKVDSVVVEKSLKTTQKKLRNTRLPQPAKANIVPFAGCRFPVVNISRVPF